VVRFPNIQDFDIVLLDECGLCGSKEGLALHHEVPISFKWLREYMEEVPGVDGEEGYERTKDALARKYYSSKNRTVICRKCQHEQFHTFRMCHFCEVYEDPDQYNACAVCFRDSLKRRVRENKMREKERTIEAINDIIESPL
jgi:hypothetical protein